MKTIYAIQDHGPDCYGLYFLGKKRLCVISDCDEKVAQRIATKLNERDEFRDALMTRDLEMAKLRAELAALRSEIERRAAALGDGGGEEFRPFPGEVELT